MVCMSSRIENTTVLPQPSQNLGVGQPFYKLLFSNNFKLKKRVARMLWVTIFTVGVEG